MTMERFSEETMFELKPESLEKTSPVSSEERAHRKNEVQRPRAQNPLSMSEK